MPSGDDGRLKTADELRRLKYAPSIPFCQRKPRNLQCKIWRCLLTLRKWRRRGVLYKCGGRGQVRFRGVGAVVATTGQLELTISLKRRLSSRSRVNADYFQRWEQRSVPHYLVHLQPPTRECAFAARVSLAFTICKLSSGTKSAKIRSLRVFTVLLLIRRSFCTHARV